VSLAVEADDATLRLNVRDHGAGFDPEQALAAGATAGLSGMRERAALLGGTLTVQSAPGQGTLVSAELPLPGPAEHASP
jgi:signal transduction histidine kinase